MIVKPPKFPCIFLVENHPAFPVPNRVRIKAPSFDPGRIVHKPLGKIGALEFIVSENEVLKRLRSGHTPLLKSSRVVADTPTPGKLLQIMKVLRQNRSEYAISPKTRPEQEIALMAASLKIPVRLFSLEHCPPKALTAILEYFLYSPTLQSPIEPFYSICQAIAKAKSLSLWDLFAETHQRDYFIDADRNITLSPRWASKHQFFGTIKDTVKELGNSPLWKELAQWETRLFLSKSRCAFCSCYHYCGGYWTTTEHTDRMCVFWQQVINQLVDVYKQFNADILSGESSICQI